MHDSCRARSAAVRPWSVPSLSLPVCLSAPSLRSERIGARSHQNYRVEEKKKNDKLKCALNIKVNVVFCFVFLVFFFAMSHSPCGEIKMRFSSTLEFCLHVDFWRAGQLAGQTQSREKPTRFYRFTASERWGTMPRWCRQVIYNNMWTWPSADCAHRWLMYRTQLVCCD